MAQGNNSYKRQDNTQEIKKTSNTFKEVGNDARKIYKNGQKLYKTAQANTGSGIKTNESAQTLKAENFNKLQRLEERQLNGKQISKTEANFYNSTVKGQAEVLDTKSAAWKLSAKDRQVLVEMSKTKDSRILMQLATQASDKKLGLEWARLAKNETTNDWLKDDAITKREILKERRLQAKKLQTKEDTLNEKKAKKAAELKQETFRKEAMAAKKSNEAAKAVGNGAKVLKTGERTLKGSMVLKAGDATLKGSKAAAAGAKEAAKKAAKEASKEASKELAKDATISAASKVTIVTAIIGAINTIFKTIVKFAESGDKITGDKSKTKKMLTVVVSILLIVMLPMLLPAIILLLFTMVPHNPGYQTNILAPAAIAEVKTAYSNAMDYKLDLFLEGTGLTRDEVATPAYSLHLKQCVAYWYITRDADAQREVKYGSSPFIADGNYCYGAANYSAQTSQLLNGGEILSYATPTPVPQELIEEIDGADKDIQWGVGYVSDTEPLPLDWSSHHAVPRSIGIYITGVEGSDYSNLVYCDDEFWAQDQYKLTCSDLYALYKTVQDMNMIMVVPENKTTPTGSGVWDGDEWTATFSTTVIFKTISNYRDPVEFAKEQNRSEEEIAALQQIVDGEGPVYEEFEHFWKALFRTRSLEAVDYPSLPINRGLALWSAMGGEIAVDGTYYNSYGNTWPSTIADRYFNDVNGGAKWKDYWNNRNSTTLSGLSKISNLEDFGYELSPNSASYENSWTIAGYLYESIGYYGNGPSRPAWCAAFVSYCFQNGEQGYFDIPYAWTLNASSGAGDTSGAFCSINSLGRFGTYDELVAMRQEVEQQISLVSSQGVTYASSASADDLDSTYYSKCLTLANLFGIGPDGSGCRDYNGTLEYESLGFSSLYSEMDSTTTISSRVSYIQAWATTQAATWNVENLQLENSYFNCLNDDASEVEIKTALVNFAISEFSKVLITSTTDQSIYANTPEGYQKCYEIGVIAFNRVQLGESTSKFDWWPDGTTYANSALCADAYYAYAVDNNLSADDVLADYNVATENGALSGSGYDVPDMYLGWAWMTGNNGNYWGRSIPIWDPSNGYAPYTVYLHTNNYHVAFVHPAFSSGFVKAPFSNWMAGTRCCYYDNADNYLNLFSQSTGTVFNSDLSYVNPWNDSKDICLLTNWQGDHPYGYPLDFKWDPYNEGPMTWLSSAERIGWSWEGENPGSDKVWAVYHHESEKYIPYYDAVSCSLYALPNIYYDSTGASAGYFDLAWFCGANAANYYDNLTYAPLYDLFAEISPVSYSIYYSSTGCTQIKNSLTNYISHDSVIEGANFAEPGDVMVSKGHIRLVVDRWKDTVTGKWYIVTIEGNTKARPGYCVLKFWSEDTYCGDTDSCSQLGLWYHEGSDSYYDLYRVFNEINEF